MQGRYSGHGLLRQGVTTKNTADRTSGIYIYMYVCVSFYQKLYNIPCGKLLHNYGKSPHLMGKKYRTKPWLSMGHGFKKAQVMAHNRTNLRRCSLANGIKWPNTEEVLSENI